MKTGRSQHRPVRLAGVLAVRLVPVFAALATFAACAGNPQGGVGASGTPTAGRAAAPSGAAAGASPGAQSASPLLGTTWRLVRFQSSDDTIGSIVPPQAERYTLAFSGEGLLSLGLDCNRGTARWEASPAPADLPAGSGRQSGALAITPGPMTRAWCGERAIDARLMRDLADVRSFVIEKGRLSLVLKVDGGSYLFERP